eukprot:2032064-Amphidinium_carterae.1
MHLRVRLCGIQSAAKVRYACGHGLVTFLAGGQWTPQALFDKGLLAINRCQCGEEQADITHQLFCCPQLRRKHMTPAAQQTRSKVSEEGRENIPIPKENVATHGPMSTGA